ncbi:hypothetical protein BDD12DRAFT_468673 [Trichophaea hybrida]|nr:hypothetical protein BDD12DRAFT_468673 [Trichophaea hybrida]
MRSVEKLYAFRFTLPQFGLDPSLLSGCSIGYKKSTAPFRNFYICTLTVFSGHYITFRDYFSPYTSLYVRRQTNMSTDPLNIRLNTELRCRSSAKQTIIETLWGEQFTDTTQFQNNEPRFAIYLRYYERECRLSSGGVPFDTHRQVLDAISVMSDERHKPFHVLQTALSAKFPSFDAASTGIKRWE